MANGRVLATRIGPSEKPKNTIICPRCGRFRSSGGKNRGKLCRDCRSTMTTEEVEMWSN